jgi:hypothetical protein
MCECACACACAPSLVHMHIPMYMRPDFHVRARTHMRAYTHARVYAFSCTCKKRTYTRAQRPTPTDVCALHSAHALGERPRNCRRPCACAGASASMRAHRLRHCACPRVHVALDCMALHSDAWRRMKCARVRTRASWRQDSRVARTQLHGHTHARIITHAHIYVRMRMRLRMCICTERSHMHIPMHMRADMYVRMRLRMRMRMCTEPRSHAQSHAYARGHVCANAHVHVHRA